MYRMLGIKNFERVQNENIAFSPKTFINFQFFDLIFFLSL